MAEIEYYDGKPILEADCADELIKVAQRFRSQHPDIPLEKPYVVRIMGQIAKGFDEDATIGVAMLNNSVVIIGDYAFWYCTSLTSIEIPNSVKKIGESAFDGCTNLTSIKIPNSVKRIGDYAFCGCTSLTSIEIPNSVKKIGDYAFCGCTSLTSIVIPDSVEEIGDEAFSDCTSLTNISVAEGNPVFDSRDNCNAIINTEENTLTVGCASTMIPDSVGWIGWNAFKGCANLTNIVIPDSVVKIGGDAFCGCANLTNIVIPDSVGWIGSNAFKDCANLTNIVIPDSVEEIGDEAFSDCTSLTRITIPDFVKVIGRCAFSGCTSLINIVIPDSVVKIGESAFSGCTSLTNIVIPDSVEEIGDDAFKGCTSLKEIYISNPELLKVEDKMLVVEIPQSQKTQPKERETFTVNGVSFDMIRVEGGTFPMGALPDPDDNDNDWEELVHYVTLRSFFIGETAVTQALWQAVMGSNPSCFTGNIQRPVESVSWNDCQEFIRKLNSLTGKNFRLPTEAEWEYAARGGNKSKEYIYSGSNNLDVVAWYADNSGEWIKKKSWLGLKTEKVYENQTHPVKQKQANELGLYDMSGNVWEWCQDWCDENYYSVSPRNNPKGPSSGSDRVCRGGGWCAWDCRSSDRYFYDPNGRVHILGLRLVLSE